MKTCCVVVGFNWYLYVRLLLSESKKEEKAVAFLRSTEFLCACLFVCTKLC